MRFLVFVLSSLVLSGICNAQEADLTTYRILEIKQNKYDTSHSPTDPNALYMYTVYDGSSGAQIMSGMRYKEVQGLMKYFHVEVPAQLSGKTFSTNLEMNMAMNLMEIQAENDFKYVPPSKEELYQRTVQSLANMTCPKFDDVDNATSLRAFQVGFGKDEDAFFDKLRDDVARASGGKVTLSEDKPEDHKISCGCLGTKNARITDGLSKIEFMFTPGAYNPFMCEKKEIAVDPNKAVGSLSSASQDARVVENAADKSVVPVAVQPAAPELSGKAEDSAAK